MRNKTFFSLAAGLLLLQSVPVSALDRDGVTDDLIAGRVESTLYNNFYLDQYGLEVKVKDRKVALDGIVETEPERELAENLALSVSGVQSVDNDIKVDPVKAVRKNTDGLFSKVEELTTTTAIKLKLEANRYTSGNKIGVETKDSVVTLSGAVPSKTAIEVAQSIAQNTYGVRDVKNEIRIANPTGVTEKAENAAKDVSEAMSDAWISTKVRSSLAFSNDFPGSSVDTTTSNGIVTLTGTVRSDYQKKKIEETVSDIKGVKQVKNNLSIKSNA